VRQRSAILFLCALPSVAATSSPAFAQETTTYTYDALGRIVTVNRSGGPANGTAAEYTYDAAGNRTLVSTTGATGGGGGNGGGGASVNPRQGFVVTPLGGYALVFYRN